MRLSIILFIFSLLSPQAFADATLQFSSSDQRATINIKNQRLNIASEDLNNSIIYDDLEKVWYLIDHSDKSYRRLDQQTIQRLEGLSSMIDQQLGTLPEKHRAQIGEFLNINLSKPQSNLVMKPAGSKQVANNTCQLYKLSQAEKIIGAACISQNRISGLSTQDYQTLLNAQTQLLALSKHAKKFEKYFTQTIPPLDKLNITGLIIQSNYTTKQHNSSFQLQTVSNQPLNIIALPANYQPKPIGDFLN